MFPHCSISLSGLQPFANYVIMVDMVPVDSFKYKVCNTHPLYAPFWVQTQHVHFLLDVTVSHILFCLLWSKKNNILQYVKYSSLQPDIGLPTLGHPPLHIKAFHCFLFVHSRLEAQSISIPPYSQSVKEGTDSHPYIRTALTSTAVAHLVTHLVFSTHLKTMKYTIKEEVL